MIANGCSCSVPLETNVAMIVLWKVFSLSCKLIFLIKEQDQRNAAFERKMMVK